MDKMMEQLRDYGADIEGVMGRFLDDLDLYKTCFTAFATDEAFSKLGEALSMMHYEEAFEYAHTLKGITGNMGLTPLYQLICKMVEALRNNEYSDLTEDYAAVMNQLDQLRALQKSCETH